MAESLIAISEGSGKNVSTQSMTIAGSLVQQERAINGIGLVTLPGTPQINGISAIGLNPVSAIDCQGRYYLIFKNLFSSTSDNAMVRIAFYDSADVLIGYSESISISNTSISDGAGKYFGDNIIYTNDFCAKSIKLNIISISGTIYSYIGVA